MACEQLTVKAELRGGETAQHLRACIALAEKRGGSPDPGPVAHNLLQLPTGESTSSVLHGCLHRQTDRHKQKVNVCV